MPGRKSDMQDCQWLQKLMRLGFLRAAWRPDDGLCVVRAVVRQRRAFGVRSCNQANALLQDLTPLTPGRRVGDRSAAR